MRYKTNRFNSQGRVYQRDRKQKFKRKTMMVREVEYFWFCVLILKSWLYFGLYWGWGQDLLSLLENK